MRQEISLAVGEQMALFQEFVGDIAHSPDQGTLVGTGGLAFPSSRLRAPHRRNGTIQGATNAQSLLSRSTKKQQITIDIAMLQTKVCETTNTWFRQRILDWLNHFAPSPKTLPLTAMLDHPLLTDDAPPLGIGDAVWTLTVVNGNRNAIRLFTLNYAKWALRIFEERFPEDKRPRAAVEAAERRVTAGIDVDEVRTANDGALQAAEAAKRSLEGDKAEMAAWLIWKIVAKPTYEAYRAHDDLRDITYCDVFLDWEDEAETEFKNLCRLEGRYGSVLDERPLFLNGTI